MINAIHPLTAFDYTPDELPAAELVDELRLSAAAVEHYARRTGELLTRGESYFKSERRFKQWCIYVLSYRKGSFETARNYMKLYRVWLENPTIADHPRLIDRAKYTLGAPTANITPERLTAIMPMIESGQLTENAAKVAAYGTDEQLALMVTGNLPNGVDKTAAALTEINKLKQRRGMEELVAKCLAWGVSTPEQVVYLRDVYNRAYTTRNAPKPSKTWEMLCNDNGVLNGYGWSKAIGLCDTIDLERHHTDRQVKAISDKDDTLYDWVLADVTVTATGELVLPAEFRHYVKSGRVTKVKLRVKRQN